MDWPLRFGVFMAPFHPVGQNPTLALQRDLELIDRLDELGYDEAWFGEHHSAGYELISSPEVFIAAAAARTRRIRLGTGVSSLPYHHPLILADRMVLLDHLTRGRVMFGVGPGALPSDAYMMGIDPLRQREMMEESLEAILALLESDEPVNRSTDWFTLRDARLQLRPFTLPRFEVAVAAQISPAGPRAAGRFGVSLLSLGATTAGGFDVLGSHWQVMEQRATEFGATVDRRQWRLVGPMHLAETEEQARADVAFGLTDWCDYFRRVAALPLAPDVDNPEELVDAMNGTGLAVIGTPDMAVAQIQRLIDQSGGFGCYLFMAHDWADREATLASYELFARYVAPLFQAQVSRPVASRDWAIANRESFIGGAMAAVMKAVQDHHAEREAGAPGLASADAPARSGSTPGLASADAPARSGSAPPDSVVS
jgi:limonene 1,2-monooxygenase